MIPGEPPRYAGFWRRVAAYLIDSFLFSVIAGLLAGPGFLNAELWSAQGLLRTLVVMLLTVSLWVRFQGTPGKLLMGCRVVDADSFTAVSVKQAVLRFVSYLVSIIPLGLGFLWIARDPRKQGFHDKIAHTVVLFDESFEPDDESNKSLDQLLAELR